MREHRPQGENREGWTGRQATDSKTSGPAESRSVGEPPAGPVPTADPGVLELLERARVALVNRRTRFRATYAGENARCLAIRSSIACIDQALLELRSTGALDDDDRYCVNCLIRKVRPDGIAAPTRICELCERLG